MKISKFFSKETCFLILILIIGGFNVHSQDILEVKNLQAQMSKGMQNCYSVEIPGAVLKTVQQNWVKKLQENIKVKVAENGLELVLARVVKTEIINDTISIYSLLIQKDTMVNIDIFVEIGSVFFSPKDDKTDLATDKIDNNIKNYLRSFAVEQYTIVVSNELEDQEKVLKTLENDLEKLEKTQENLEKDNSSLENDIEEKEREVKEIDGNIDSKNQELMKHNASMLAIVTETDKDAAKEKQKILEKEKKDLEKSRSKARDDISSYKSKIEKNNKAIEDCKNEQEVKAQEIEVQNQLVTTVKTKLNGIK
jgi:chromosome segregation ATPase